MKEKRKKFLKICKTIIYVLFLFILYFAVFINERFDDISFEQLLYNVVNTKGANYSIVFVGIGFIAIRLLITLCIVFLIYWVYKYLKLYID